LTFCPRHLPRLGPATNLLEAGRDACSTENRGTNQTVSAPMLLKLLEADRAHALKGMPMKKEGTPYL
jgi:hypothetical protein